MAGPGARLQDRPAQDPGPATEGRGGAGRVVRPPSVPRRGARRRRDAAEHPGGEDGALDCRPASVTSTAASPSSAAPPRAWVLRSAWPWRARARTWRWPLARPRRSRSLRARSRSSNAALGGRIDILVNAAGVTGPVETPVWEIKTEDWDHVLAVNVKGTFLPIKHVLPTMIAQRYGKIVN